MKYDLIGIHGKPHSGKDTICKLFCAENSKYEGFRHGPSVYVKRTAAAMFDVPVHYFDDEKMKETIDPYWNMTYREMAQKVGKESSRDVFGEDFWMRHVGKKLAEMRSPNRRFALKGFPMTRMILPDIRYANEAQWVKDNGGIMIFVFRDIDRPVALNETHPAEHGLSRDMADVIVYNNGTVEELYAQVETALEGMRKNDLVISSNGRTALS